MIDLHTHSNASDGSLSPTELVHLAQACSITYLALTDHNTIAGLAEFLHAATGTAIYAIPGVEITSELGPDELHILAMNLPKSSFSQVQDVMKEVLLRSETSKRELVDNLRKAGYQLSYEEIQNTYPNSVINRAHIGMALKDAGYVPSVSVAFETLLNEEAGYYHPAERLSAIDAIHIILDLHAIPVWAHPFYQMDTNAVKATLEQLVPAGLVGMETYYSTYTPEQTQDALTLAELFKLKLSGGSDFHGTPKPDIRLGVGRGKLNIPEYVAENLLDN